MQYPDPLEALNPRQREAATHGTGDSAADARPLLVIAASQHPSFRLPVTVISRSLLISLSGAMRDHYIAGARSA